MCDLIFCIVFYCIPNEYRTTVIIQYHFFNFFNTGGFVRTGTGRQKNPEVVPRLQSPNESGMIVLRMLSSLITHYHYIGPIAGEYVCI